MSCGRILENDEDEILSIPQAASESQANRCCRCQSQEVDVHIRNTPWCRNCFSSQVTNKFAQGLRPAKEYCRPPKGQSKEAQNCGSLVVHYTDTPACLCLLDLLRRYIQSNDTRSTSKWQCPVDFSGVEVVCVGLGSSHTCFTSDTDQVQCHNFISIFILPSA
ncbi:uncharacterized protein MELLADRAFT_90043 [Melampsora larici-populina 98AG31]|uniref:Uncharacterized protein n=1 Tax=Melampsora larici-populina (strain 98AG31 / pathotype 3-4-7) TaxID=747676 RepID=F4RVI6_MELLP|nr:uncharacterized protein MELLADRAFT_90043 [Melampsora larici-populina 98AG31]EGG03661.1 hypothetical protein MELLADRAFT_90043 [Melampsora larici-populina 98AG31]